MSICSRNGPGLEETSQFALLNTYPPSLSLCSTAESKFNQSRWVRKRFSCLVWNRSKLSRTPFGSFLSLVLQVPSLRQLEIHTDYSQTSVYSSIPSHLSRSTNNSHTLSLNNLRFHDLYLPTPIHRRRPEKHLAPRRRHFQIGAWCRPPQASQVFRLPRHYETVLSLLTDDNTLHHFNSGSRPIPSSVAGNKIQRTIEALNHILGLLQPNSNRWIQSRSRPSKRGYLRSTVHPSDEEFPTAVEWELDQGAGFLVVDRG